jgi:transcriptional regulator with XRE-family HTH domain
MESIRDVVGRNVARLLDSSGLKLVDIARSTGVSNTTIQRWKSGTHPPEIDNLEKLAKVLSVDPWEFYRQEEGVVKAPLNISTVIKMMAAIPDEVYEKAQGVPLGDEAWIGVIASLEVAAERIARQKGNHTNHS